MAKNNNHKAVSYNKWGYIFLIPFVVVYLIFQLVPLISTIYNSFFENYRSGLTQIGPNFVGFANYVKLFEGGEIWIYLKNTMIMWVMGFVPQILVSLLLGAWPLYQTNHKRYVLRIVKAEKFYENYSYRNLWVNSPWGCP